MQVIKRKKKEITFFKQHTIIIPLCSFCQSFADECSNIIHLSIEHNVQIDINTYFLFLE